MSTDKPTAEPPEDSTYPELMPVDELGRRPIKWDGNLASIKGFMAAVNEWRQENGILDTFFSHQAVDAGRGKLAIASLDSIHSFGTTAGDWNEPLYSLVLNRYCTQPNAGKPRGESVTMWRRVKESFRDEH